MGVGVTAYTIDDAKELLRQMVFKDEPLPHVSNIIENLDVSTLDAGHILPNIGVPTVRGVWYPNLNSY